MTAREVHNNGLFDLSGRAPVVMGGGGGIGQAVALGLLGHGAAVAAVDTRREPLDEVVQAAQTTGGRLEPFTCDATNPEAVAGLFDRIEATLGGVDVVVNVFFIGLHSKPEEITLENFELNLKVNVVGYHIVAQEAGRRMIARGRGGSIVNFGSIAGLTAMGRRSYAYSICKGAINQLTKELAVEWAKYGIRVNAILPCQTMTPGFQERLRDPEFTQPLMGRLLMGISANRLADPEDMVGPVVFLASDAAKMVTGTLLPVDGGNLALNAGGSHIY